jgi:hypothetical protein
MTAMVAGTAPSARMTASTSSAMSRLPGQGMPWVMMVDSSATTGRPADSASFDFGRGFDGGWIRSCGRAPAREFRIGRGLWHGLASAWQAARGDKSCRTGPRTDAVSRPAQCRGSGCRRSPSCQPAVEIARGQRVAGADDIAHLIERRRQQEDGGRAGRCGKGGHRAGAGGDKAAREAGTAKQGCQSCGVIAAGRRSAPQPRRRSWRGRLIP